MNHDSASDERLILRANVHFVLARPQFLGNIGAVARVMKNFGFFSLRLIDPPRNYKDAEARKMSVGAFDVLKQATVFTTLDAALADIGIAIGTTSGRQRAENCILAQELSTRLSGISDQDQIALIFGDERDGLRGDELKRCHCVLTIPTQPELPSLNVAQALGIVAYELVRAGSIKSADCKQDERHGSPKEPKNDSRSILATGADVDEIFGQIGALFDAAEFSRAYNRQLVLAELRSAFQRMLPTKRECDLIKGALIRLNQKLSQE
ncbi:MAG TPA: RNA methyltransferase [Candidatus Obscuribacterales bacterium]